ncbi:unnamed protein product, partial [Discosporangium mesarthrocarpum]
MPSRVLTTFLLVQIVSARCLRCALTCFNASTSTDLIGRLIPGMVLLGRYPALCPSDSESQREEASQRVREIIDRAGVTDFVCLQEEIPPQDKTSEWRSFPAIKKAPKASPRAEVAGFSSYQADAISASTEALHIRASGDPTQPLQPPYFLHFPIPDLSPANSLTELAALVDEIQDRVTSGRVIYIHCWGGRGRTGLAAACLLGALYGEETSLDAEEALTRVDTYFRLRSGTG